MKQNLDGENFLKCKINEENIEKLLLFFKYYYSVTRKCRLICVFQYLHRINLLLTVI